MTSDPLRGLQLVTALVLGACHLVFPHAPGRGPADASRDPTPGEREPARELGPLDLARLLDARRADAPSCLTGLSCKWIKSRCRNAPSGKYLVGPTDAGLPFEVYCDMEIDGGGWTLVGGSAPGADVSQFGWSSDTGALSNDTEPYSIDLGSRGYPFSQVLIGARAAGKAWGADVYKFEVPPNFIAANGATAFDTGAVETVKGSCKPDLSVFMLRFLGCTATPAVFHTRDNPKCENFGLMADGFNLAALMGSPCDRWGNLQNKQGMIFVR